LLTEVALAVGQRFGVQFDKFHNDSTSVSVCGQYGAAAGRSIRGRTAPAITYGHSKAHRPDLKQRLFILAERHKLSQGEHTVQVFQVQFTELQHKLLTLLGVEEKAFH
jgi:hypothetical protein